MTADREMLKLAAKAAGYWSSEYRCVDALPHSNWDPLTDDGDALRLAVKLQLAVIVREEDTRVNQRFDDAKKREYHEGDPYAATRRAIVRAAAEMAQKPRG